MLVDSGASKSCLSEAFFKSMRVTLQPIDKRYGNEPTHLVIADSQHSLLIIGTTYVNVKISGYVIHTNFYVVRDLSQPVILGMNFLSQTNANIRIGDKVLDLFDGLVIAPLVSIADGMNTLHLTRTVTIPPKCEMFVLVDVNKRSTIKTAIVQPMPYMQRHIAACGGYMSFFDTCTTSW
jgi:gag-polyprotein putative aspartyl protease